MNRNRIAVFIVRKIVLGILIFTVSCSMIQQGEPTPIEPQKPPFPDFIMEVAPMVEDKETYDENLSQDHPFRGIVVQLGLSFERDFTDGDWVEKLRQARLFVDDQLVSNDLLRVAAGAVGVYWLGWAVELSPGLHDVTFQITAANGELLEYSWQIYIIE